jgi:hypothetical protein
MAVNQNGQNHAQKLQSQRPTEKALPSHNENQRRTDHWIPKGQILLSSEWHSPQQSSIDLEIGHKRLTRRKLERFPSLILSHPSIDPNNT